MQSKIDYLFIGSFLSSQKGSLSASETVAKNLNYKNIRLVSYKQHKLFRLIDILWSILNFNGKAIHVEVYSGQAFIIAELSSFMNRFKKKKLIFTLHGGKLTEFATKNEKQVKRTFNRAHYIQTPSYFLKAYFEKWGYAVHYLPNGLDLNNFTYKRVAIKQHSLLWVRGFSKIYNPELAVKTLYQIKQKFPDATLTMIGPDSGLLQQVKQISRQLQLQDSITFTGPIANSQLQQYYQTHQVYLNTTSYESFGTAIIEAAACGIPIVSTRIGEIPYLWAHQENMMLADKIHESDFANLVEQLFHNPDLATKLSLSARKKAETFSWNNIAPEWVKLLNA